MDEDDDKPPPLVFANQVIELLGDHLFGGEPAITKQGFQLIRLVFRKLGGSWYQVFLGNPEQTDLLIQVVRSWGLRNSKDQ